MSNKVRNLLIGFGIIGIFLMVLSLSVYVKWQTTEPGLNSKIDKSVFTLFPQPISIPNVSLIDKNGQPFTTTQLKKKWTFLYFGYTLCPDICPTELTALAELAAEVTKQNNNPNWQMVFVSVDPQRDTVERLKGFVDYFDPRIQAATGSEIELRIMAKPIGIGWDKVANITAEGKADNSTYLINHSTSILLVDPQGRAVGVFSSPHDPQAMAKVFSVLVPE